MAQAVQTPVSAAVKTLVKKLSGEQIDAIRATARVVWDLERTSENGQLEQARIIGRILGPKTTAEIWEETKKAWSEDYCKARGCNMDTAGKKFVELLKMIGQEKPKKTTADAVKKNAQRTRAKTAAEVAKAEAEKVIASAGAEKAADIMALSETAEVSPEVKTALADIAHNKVKDATNKAAEEVRNAAKSAREFLRDNMNRFSLDTLRAMRELGEADLKAQAEAEAAAQAAEAAKIAEAAKAAKAAREATRKPAKAAKAA